MDTIAFFYIVKLIADQMRDMMAYKMNLMNMMAYMMRQAAMVSHWWWETGSWWVFRTWQSLSEVLSLSHNIQSFFCRKDTAKVMKTLREKVMSTGVTKQRRKRRMKKYLMKCFWTKHFSSRLWSFIKRKSKWPEFWLLEKTVPLIEILSKRFIHRVLVYHFALPYHQYFLVRTPPGERIIDVGSLVCFLLGKVSCVTLISEAIPPIPYDYYLPESNNFSFVSNFMF